MNKSPIEIIMNSKLHDEARVVSAQFVVWLQNSGDMQRLLDTLTGRMACVNAWAKENDVIIGHVKGYVTCGEETVMVSTTGDEVQTKGSRNMPEPPCEVNIGLAAIVFGIELREVEKQLEGLISNLLIDFSAEYTVIHEGAHVHDDSCGCSDHHDHTHEHIHSHDHPHDHEHSHDNEHEHHRDHENQHEHEHRHEHKS